MEESQEEQSGISRTAVLLLYLALLFVKPGVDWLEPRIGIAAAQSVAYIWALGAVSAFFYFTGNAARRYIGAFSIRGLGWGVLWGLLLFVIGGVGYTLNTLMGLDSGQSAMVGALSGLGAAGWVALFVNQLLVVVSEEFAFRGVLQDYLAENGGVWVSVPGSAALFAAYHLTLFQLLPTFLVGCGLAWLVHKRASLWPALVAHLIYNLIGLAMAGGRMMG